MASRLELSISARQIDPGGRPAIEPDGRPLAITAGLCRAIIRDRRSSHRCGRRGWFALREPGGAITGPLCSTHLRALAALGGSVAAEAAGRDGSRAA
ncbi:MAG: hypothetical protein L0227_07150 [Chloroflexi bacterium]|nr:hypothetical protein [Chloroflexota bacterium]